MLDCFGLIWLITKRVGRPICDLVYKGFNCSLVRLAEYVGLKQCEFEIECVLEIEKDERLHLGYAIDDTRMIHYALNEGVIIEEIDDYKVNGYWKF